MHTLTGVRLYLIYCISSKKWPSQMFGHSFTGISIHAKAVLRHIHSIVVTCMQSCVHASVWCMCQVTCINKASSRRTSLGIPDCAVSQMPFAPSLDAMPLFPLRSHTRRFSSGLAFWLPCSESYRWAARSSIILPHKNEEKTQPWRNNHVVLTARQFRCAKITYKKAAWSWLL